MRWAVGPPASSRGVWGRQPPPQRRKMQGTTNKLHNVLSDVRRWTSGSARALESWGPGVFPGLSS
eukprot:9638913-Alexandrium_andersonii.AAC.1